MMKIIKIIMMITRIMMMITKISKKLISKAINNK